ncbi:MAG TPA: hypothetical protein VGD67_24655 [Pseudonocardiaceae bacterium]
MALAVAGAGVAGLLTASAPPQEAAAQARAVPPIHRLVYVITEADRRITEARHRLIAECVAAQGLAYTARAETVTGDQALAELRPFGLEHLEGVTSTAVPPETPAADERLARALFGDPERRVVARGERLEVSLPAEGCQAEAENRLLGPENRVRATEVRLRLYDGEREAREQVDDDAALRRATAAWRSCLAGLGFDAPDPVRLLATLPPDADVRTHPATAADVRCKRRTGYLDVAYERLAARQQAWLDAHPGLADEWRALRHRQAVVAAVILAG